MKAGSTASTPRAFTATRRASSVSAEWFTTLGKPSFHSISARAPKLSAWSVATAAFALFQAGAAYGLSFVFAHTDGDYPLLFALGSAAMVLALAIDLSVALATRGSASAARGRPRRALRGQDEVGRDGRQIECGAHEIAQ